MNNAIKKLNGWYRLYFIFAGLWTITIITIIVVLIMQPGVLFERPDIKRDYFNEVSYKISLTYVELSEKEQSGISLTEEHKAYYEKLKNSDLFGMISFIVYTPDTRTLKGVFGDKRDFKYLTYDDWITNWLIDYRDKKENGLHLTKTDDCLELVTMIKEEYPFVNYDSIDKQYKEDVWKYNIKVFHTLF